MTTRSSSVKNFAPYFFGPDASPWSDSVLMSSIYELRFQVYCVERGFLPADDYPDQRETDEYDSDSEHFCTFNAKREVVGCVRLVRANSEQQFPLHRHCPTLYNDAYLPPPAESAEISRLVVRQDYRRRRGDTLVGMNENDSVDGSERERRINSPQILLHLYRQMYLHSRESGIRYWYAAMEVPVAIAMKRIMNFGFRQIGPPTDYYGEVVPYVLDLRELESQVGSTNPDLMAWLSEPEAICA